MAWTDLKAAVAAVIKTNGNQEITGGLLQSTLNSIIDQVGANASYKGVAIPSTAPGSPDGPVFYIASAQGTYANFGGFVLDGGFAVLSNISGSWTGTKFLKTEMDAKADHGYIGTPKSLKQVEDEKAEEITQLAGYYTNSAEYIHALIDADGKFLFGIKEDGSVEWAVGIPEPIKEHIEQIEHIKSQLLEKADKIDGKSLIDSDYAESISFDENNEFLSVTIDSDGKIIEGIRNDGTHYFAKIEVEEAKHEILSAHDYGILPSNDAITNADLMNSLLSNGNVSVNFVIPGTYKIGYSVRIGSNTKITCRDGVIFTREGTFFNVFINTGASNATYNEHITIDGLNLDITQNGLRTFDFDSPTFGLRGLVAFAFVRDLTLKNIRIHSLDQYQYKLHVNMAERVIIEHFDIRGEKDGIHLSSISDFIIRDGVLSTLDDGIGLNGYDLYDCNLVSGNIQYGVIENIVTLKRDVNPLRGSGIRLMVGAFVDWYSGMEVMRGELVRNSSGRIFKVIADVPDETFKNVYTSTTEPNHITYNGKQADNGFYWKYVSGGELITNNAPYHSININNIIFRNIKVNQGSYVALQDVWEDGASNSNRTLHPDVPTAYYPHIEFLIFDNLINYGSVSPHIISGHSMVVTDIKLTNVRGFLRSFKAMGGDVRQRYILDNYDFTRVVEPKDVEAGENTEVVIRDCYRLGNIIVDSAGSVKSNCSISALPSNPIKGDTVILDGVFKYYNGSNWV